MPIQISKYILIITCVLSTNLLIANIDSTRKKFLVELNSEILYGQSWFISQANVVNKSHTYGMGINIGYQFRPSHKIKMGIALNRSAYEYLIIRKNVIGPDGINVDIEDYREETSMNNLSFGLMYSKEITPRFSIDIEALLFFKIFNEAKMRSGIGIDDFHQEGLIAFGISYATKENYLGLKYRFKYALTNYLDLGFTLSISDEEIRMPKIENDSTFNLLYGVSATYRI